MSQKRVVDMSKGFENVSNPIRYTQQLPVQTQTLQQYQQQQPVQTQQYLPVQQTLPQYQQQVPQEKGMLYRPPLNFNVQNQQKVVENRNPKYNGTDISHFNLDGCKSMDDAYKKNENKIKIIPE